MSNILLLMPKLDLSRPSLDELWRFHRPILRGSVRWVAKGIRTSALAAELLALLAGLFLAINPVLFHWLGSPSAWLATPFFVVTLLLELARANYRYFRPIQDERDELGRQLQLLTGIVTENHPRVRTAVVESFPMGMRLSADERFVLFCWALNALEGNDLDYTVRSVSDRYELRCYGQTLAIERERRADLEEIAASFKVMVNRLKLPEG